MYHSLYNSVGEHETTKWNLKEKTIPSNPEKRHKNKLDLGISVLERARAICNMLYIGTQLSAPHGENI